MNRFSPISTKSPVPPRTNHVEGIALADRCAQDRDAREVAQLGKRDDVRATRPSGAAAAARRAGVIASRDKNPAKHGLCTVLMDQPFTETITLGPASKRLLGSRE